MTAQFRVVPTVDGGFLVVGNEEFRKFLSGLIESSATGETSRVRRKLLKALVRGLAKPVEPPVQTLVPYVPVTPTSTE